MITAVQSHCGTLASDTGISYVCDVISTVQAVLCRFYTGLNAKDIRHETCRTTLQQHAVKTNYGTTRFTVRWTPKDTLSLENAPKA